MKKPTIIIWMSCLLVAGCTAKELSHEEALKLIQQEKHYPKVFDLEINRVDPDGARKLLNTGLEADGIVTVQGTQKLSDAGKPLIYFTDKAKPYLLLLPKGEKEDKMQNVKVADEVLAQVTGIQSSNNGKNAVVAYTTVYKNITPFAVLINLDFNKKQTHKAYFSLYNDGWKMEEKPSAAFIEFEK